MLAKKRKTGDEPSMEEVKVYLREISPLNYKQQNLKKQIDIKEKIKESLRLMDQNGKIDQALLDKYSAELQGTSSYFENNMKALKVFGPGSEKDKEILISDLSEKSPAELEEMGVTEITKHEIQTDKFGAMSTKNFVNDSELLTEMERVSQLEEQIDELKNEKEISLEIALERQRKEDEQRSVKVATALMEGSYVDDISYKTMLFACPDLVKRREAYLKEYFSNQPNAKVKAIHQLKKEKNDYEAETLESIYDKMSPLEKETVKVQREYLAEKEDYFYRFFDDGGEDDKIEFGPSKIKSRLPTSIEGDVDDEHLELKHATPNQETKLLDRPGRALKKPIKKIIK